MPIDVILFGGRRATNVPLVTESYDWEHGVFVGATVSSEQTAAAEGTVGPAAPRPVRHAAVLRLQHGRLLGALARDRHGHRAAKLPKIFQVNWFRKDADGKFLWPGFGDNSRVARVDHQASRRRGGAVDTAIGRLPAEGSLDFTGLDLSAEPAEELFAIDPVTWLAEADLTEEYFEKFGDRVPAELRGQLAALRSACRAPSPPATQLRVATSTALIVCMWFSAWSNTMLAGDSNTSSATSTPSTRP